MQIHFWVCFCLGLRYVRFLPPPRYEGGERPFVCADGDAEELHLKNTTRCLPTCLRPEFLNLCTKAFNHFWSDFYIFFGCIHRSFATQWNNCGNVADLTCTAAHQNIALQRHQRSKCLTAVIESVGAVSDVGQQVSGQSWACGVGPVEGIRSQQRAARCLPMLSAGWSLATVRETKTSDWSLWVYCTGAGRNVTEGWFTMKCVKLHVWRAVGRDDSL